MPITPAVSTVQETILNIIHTAFGTIDLFNDSVRRIMRRIVGLSADRHLVSLYALCGEG